MSYVGERDLLIPYMERKGPDGQAEYRRQKNRISIDGLPAFPDDDLHPALGWLRDGGRSPSRHRESGQRGVRVVRSAAATWRARPHTSSAVRSDELRGCGSTDEIWTKRPDIETTLRAA
jgi:hypothetical protein